MNQANSNESVVGGREEAKFVSDNKSPTRRRSTFLKFRVRRLLGNMLVAGAAGHGNVAEGEGEDPALSAGLTSDTRIVFRRQLSYPLYYFRFVSYLALVMAGLHTTV